MSERDLPSGSVSTYDRWAILVAAVVSVAVAVLLAWAASGFGVFYETLFRVGPTVEGGGIGTDWVVGNTITALDFLIALTHAADAIMGTFILFMVFLHWASFRRLAARMRQPGESAGGVAADGGRTRDRGRPDGRGDGTDPTDGGESE